MNESDLKYYIDNKELINEKHCSIIERKGEFAGLRNHGATCYLNSLIQCLFHNSAFVKLILETTDNPDSAIITELKKLFSRLIMSTNQAIDAQALLTAFGWSKAEMFEQHDIHELFSVLIEALGKESPHLNSEINKLFTGHLTGKYLYLSFTYIHIYSYITQILILFFINIYRCTQMLFMFP